MSATQNSPETGIPIDSPEPVANLIYGAGDDEKIKIPVVAGDEIKIGREKGRCLFYIPDPSVSKEHFRIYTVVYDEAKKDAFQPLVYCEDLESTNGTFINNICIGNMKSEKRAFLLGHGDIIEIKPDWRFTFQQSLAPNICLDQEQLDDCEYFRDRYVVSGRILGKGQYGGVYLAKDAVTFKQLACKIVNLKEAALHLAESTQPPLAIEKAQEKQKIWREVKILSELSHPNIVRLHKAFLSDSNMYVFTELAPAGDLFSYIESHGGSLDDVRTRFIGRQVCLAVQYMHSKGIAHRDIKAENVLITQTNYGGRVILTDFGFANYAEVKTGRLFSKVGTAGFTAPEVENDGVHTGYTMAADLWSLGVLTACMITGNSIIPREDLEQFSQIEISQRFLDADEWRYLPSKALNFLRRLLTTDPARRMTATEALNHDWFRKPSEEAKELEKGYRHVTKYWKPRDESEDIIEYLPRKVQDPEPKLIIPSVQRSRRKVPDASLSPYFGLDRHLYHKSPSKRRDVLDSLTQSGSHFLTPGTQKPLPVASTLVSRNGRPTLLEPVHNVNGNDIFGKSSLSNSLCDTSDHDLLDVAKADPISHRSAQQDMSLVSPGVSSDDPHEVSKYKRARRNLERTPKRGDSTKRS